MRPIDADKLIEELNEEQVEGDELYKGLGKAKLITCYQPTIDAVPVVRCKDCKWYKHEEEDEVGMGWCANFKPASNEHFICWDNWYCGDGERKDG